MGSEWNRPEDWYSTSWGQLVDLKYGKSLRDYHATEGTYPVFGTNGPIGKCNEVLCAFPSVIIGRKGAYRGVHYSPEPFYVIDTAFYLEPKVDINLKWAYYSLLTQDINGMDSGSAIPSTRKEDFFALKVQVPPRSIQDSIVEHLEALDEKIELNRQMNATLEAMAQALFKSWFVDFDPVIDNALAAGNPIPDELQARAQARQALGDNRKPLPEDLRKQFPDRFVLTEEMGWVPAGWEVKAVEQAIMVNPRVSLSKGKVAMYVDMKALPTSGFSIQEVIDKTYSGGAKYENGDVLLARITPCLENGKTGLVDFLKDNEAGFGSTEFIVLRKKGAVGIPFAACLARDEGFRQHCIQNMVGSSGRQRVQNSCFESYFLCLPKNPKVLQVFDDSCAPFFGKMTSLKNEIQSLTQLRDSLLPNLLGGNILINGASDPLQVSV